MLVDIGHCRSSARQPKANKSVSPPQVLAPTGVLVSSTRRRTRFPLLGLLLGVLLAVLDNFIVATAMPTILRVLGKVGLVSWVVTAITLTSAVSTPVWGKLGDLYGRKLMFQLAVAGFLAGSVLAALALSMGPDRRRRITETAVPAAPREGTVGRGLPALPRDSGWWAELGGYVDRYSEPRDWL